MRPISVEFHSASSDGMGRGEKEERRIIAVKPKFADKYVGRPKKQRLKATTVFT